MLNHRLSWLIILTHSVWFGISGCTSTETYRYENIKKEYAALICRPAPFQSEPSQGQACVLKRAISLTEALDIARNNNPDILMAAARIRQAESMIGRSNASFYPSLELYTEYLQGDSPSAFLFKTIDQRKLPPGTNFNDPGWFDNYESGAQAKFNLYNGGRDILNKQMAETDVSISESDRQGIENALAASVIHAYYSALAAGEFIQTAEESVATVNSQLRVMKVRFESVGALKSDILSLEVRLAQARETRL